MDSFLREIATYDEVDLKAITEQLGNTQAMKIREVDSPTHWRCRASTRPGNGQVCRDHLTLVEHDDSAGAGFGLVSESSILPDTLYEVIHVSSSQCYSLSHQQTVNATLSLTSTQKS